MSAITTHVLDTSCGRPAEGMPVVLERASSAGEGWEVVGRATTDADGRARELMPPGAATSGGRYRLIFDTEAYFGATGRPAFYPQVAVQFVVERAEDHYHVPLLLSPYGYSTYRGS